MRFSYEAAFGKSSANGYERPLLDAMSGDATLFSRGVRLGDRLRVRHADLDDVPGCARSTRGWGSWRSPARHYVPSWLAWYPRRRIEAWILIRERSGGIDAGRLPFVNDVPRSLSGDRVLSLVSI
jgi:hypothetical protein